MIYLNNTATSYPKPQQVLQAVEEALYGIPIVSGRSSGRNKSIIDECREKTSEFFGASSPKQVIFTSGSTEALNLAIKGLDLQDKHIIATATEHNSVLRPIYDLHYSQKAEVEIIACDEIGFVEPSNIENAIKPNTALVIVNHCSNVTGIVQDIKKISEITKRNNAKLLVDASQSAGQVEIDIQAMGIDMLAFTAHKSLFGIAGTGALIIGDNIELKPLKHGGTGYQSRLLTQPEDLPMKYESGTPNLIGIAALLAGMEYIKSESLEKINDFKKRLFSDAYDALITNERVKIYGNKDSKSTMSFNIEGVSPDESAFIMENSFDIILRSGLHCCPLIHQYIKSGEMGTVRMSLSYFSMQNDIEQFIAAVEKISKHC